MTQSANTITTLQESTLICSFVGNRGLCGKQVSVICKDDNTGSGTNPEYPSSGDHCSWPFGIWIVLVIVNNLISIIMMHLFIFGPSVSNVLHSNITHMRALTFIL